MVFEGDAIQAAKWHLIARQAGVSDFTLDIMLSRLAPEQRVEAERLVDGWEAGRLTDDASDGQAAVDTQPAGQQAPSRP